MPNQTDFLSIPWREAISYLTGCRKRVRSNLNILEETTNGSLVALALLDGARDHKHHHPTCPAFHYTNFADDCRRLFKENGGEILPLEYDGKIDCLAVSWFEADGIDAVVAASAIHNHFRRLNDLYRPPWMHEKHAAVGIGRGEYAAYRMLTMASRDQTLIDPLIWTLLPEQFRRLAQTHQVNSPDLEALHETRDVKGRVGKILAAHKTKAQTALHAPLISFPHDMIGRQPL